MPLVYSLFQYIIGVGVLLSWIGPCDPNSDQQYCGSDCAGEQADQILC